jgi:hypothetical protein
VKKIMNTAAQNNKAKNTTGAVTELVLAFEGSSNGSGGATPRERVARDAYPTLH